MHTHQHKRPFLCWHNSFAKTTGKNHDAQENKILKHSGDSSKNDADMKSNEWGFILDLLIKTHLLSVNSLVHYGDHHSLLTLVNKF